jgi:hypothetical protein
MCRCVEERHAGTAQPIECGRRCWITSKQPDVIRAESVDSYKDYVSRLRLRGVSRRALAANKEHRRQAHALQ